MTKYGIHWIDGDYDEDETFTTRESADEMARYYQACADQGAEDLYLNNPGDNPYEEESFERPEYEIVEIGE